MALLSPTATPGTYVGSSIRRREDPRLVTGRATYVNDIVAAGCAQVVFVRSPHAHARIKRIDTSAARAASNVIAVVTGADLESSMQPVPCIWTLPDMKAPTRRAITADKARFVGDIVAAVVATTEAAARDAAELVDVEYEILPSVTDQDAAEIGMDPAEVRRRNFPAPDQFPYTTATGVTYDSGEYATALDKALEAVGYRQLRQEQAAARAEGRLLGIGICSFVEVCGAGPSAGLGAAGAGIGFWEAGTVRVLPTGKVTVYTGSSAHGQGHETTFAQIAADRLGLPIEDIDVVHGDTAKVPFGIGTFASRSAAVGGTAVAMSAGKVRDKATRLAAHLLEAAVDDIELEAGVFRVRGAPGRSVTWSDVGLQAFLAHRLPAGMEPGLEASTFFDPSNFTWPFGTHVCVTEVDPETGTVQVLRYVAVDDCGTVINPMIADGQVHGGITQGLGQALYEGAEYDADGQLLTGSMLDYVVPTSEQAPAYETSHTYTPSPVNPLGVKGIGEAGTIAASAAVVNSVVDALSHLGVRHLDMPLKPERVWRAIQARQA